MSRAEGATGGRKKQRVECRAARLKNSCFRLFIIMSAAYAGVAAAAAAASLFVCAAAPRPSVLVINLVFSLRPEATLFPFPKVLSINRCARAQVKGSTL